MKSNIQGWSGVTSCKLANHSIIGGFSPVTVEHGFIKTKNKILARFRFHLWSGPQGRKENAV